MSWVHFICMLLICGWVNNSRMWILFICTDQNIIMLSHFIPGFCSWIQPCASGPSAKTGTISECFQSCSLNPWSSASSSSSVECNGIIYASFSTINAYISIIHAMKEENRQVGSWDFHLRTSQYLLKHSTQMTQDHFHVIHFDQGDPILTSFKH